MLSKRNRPRRCKAFDCHSLLAWVVQPTGDTKVEAIVEPGPFGEASDTITHRDEPLSALIEFAEAAIRGGYQSEPNEKMAVAL
jgi:hypothetical protein